ncbi:Alpha-glucan water dikinase, chloroplastic [Apostasia shenzhenica]|uniref:Alpha-glucan water dikinase, chloroplastic n=1 Tax=Apostasia shenzhenica TaxID=1088818 RepID=A0A2I0AMD9_9ASPA|nr:Alpha-glucan water dikinase, chloroplastic [Apostasia shenzhenica]
MSNNLGHCAAQQVLHRSSVLENQSRIHPCTTTCLSYGVTPCSKNDNASPLKQNPMLSNLFLGKNRSPKKTIVLQGIHRAINMPICAVLTTDPSPQLYGSFRLDPNSELQVILSSPPQSSLMQITFQITNCGDSFVLHWGVISHGRKGWALPPRRPDGTKVYKNQALRTPFEGSGSSSFLTVEIDDPEVQAIEFLVLDEAQNKWFRNNGQNFHVQLTGYNHHILDKSISDYANITLPEDLVQIHAYIRWERNGRQSYTPEQQKKEYELAKNELLEEMRRGTSVDELRARLTKTPSSVKDGNNEKNLSAKVEIPDDLIQVQAYIHWEKAGKPTYTPERQVLEFEEAKKKLLVELEKGTSLSEIRQKILKGNIKSKVSRQLKDKKYFAVKKIRRKDRDIMQLVSKYSSKAIEEETVVIQKPPTALELWSRALKERDEGPTVNTRLFNLDDRELMVLVMKPLGKTKVFLATDYKGLLILHWGLSKNAREWMLPAMNTLPANSILLEMACETPFVDISSANPAHELKHIEINIDEGYYEGMPFVLRSDGYWIKNNGSDFYVEFSNETTKILKDVGVGKGTARALLDRIAQMESDAERSLMHRFSIASDLLDQAREAGTLGFAGILVWMRFMATRQLVWNKNYNVKPREISRAQDRLTDLLQDNFKSYPQYREILRIIMSTVGRGAEGDVGQRIRDEILVIQRNNDCKGGMMEEWHQKLHNNTSPDDVVICQALIDYINCDFDINTYWRTLNENGITKDRLLSYDRAIHSEPNFRPGQKDGLLRDLGNYMRTLKVEYNLDMKLFNPAIIIHLNSGCSRATYYSWVIDVVRFAFNFQAVHSGADLESAIATCLGYKSEGEGFMVGVQINPIRGLPSGFVELLEFILDHAEDKMVEPLLEGLLEARAELCTLLLNSHERLKDLIFLDIALDSAVRTAIERGYKELNNAEPEKIMYFISLVLENLALSSDDNEDLIYCLKGWKHAVELSKRKDDHWALYAKSVLDRTRIVLSTKAEYFHQVLQPSAEYLGSLLGIDQWAVNIFTEEIIRAGSAASLSALLNRIDPVLRKVAHLGSWQIISPVEVTGYVVSVNDLLSVQNKSYDQPTILVAKSVKGEEEIPDGTVAVLTPDMPDVLSHVSVRARNSKVCFATCFDPNILTEFERNGGKLFYLRPTSADIVYREIKEGDLQDASPSNLTDSQTPPSLTLVRKEFAGRYSITAEEFSKEMVGAKSRNIAYLKGKVPSWIGIPISVALPFGVFEKVLSDNLNKNVEDSFCVLKKGLAKGDYNALAEIRRVVLQLACPSQLRKELKEKMQKSGMPWPGDEGEYRWEKAWMAIKKVWASKWNERAYFSTRKVKLDHDNLCMAVLVQEIINADYAFVIHTTNPSSGDASELYAEVVKGLGETLVGGYPGRALSFICKKSNLDSPIVLGFPSKPIGLFIRQSIIFRSDSNGEDLEGYAGAGLYDSVPMDEEEAVVLDYTSDPLIVDGNFRISILSSIAHAGIEIEGLFGSPQDIEGVVRDGKIFVVQTRPQV